MLLAAFGQRRPTVDVDTLARNIAADEEAVAARVAEIADLDDPDDGIEFLTDTLTTRTIRDEAAYAGVRVTMQARLATAVIKFSLDVSFGDPVTPAPQIVELPTLRPDTSAPVQVLGYPIETVLAEKLTTAITLGPANTRVRDYADIHTLTGTHDLDLSQLREALNGPHSSETSLSSRSRQSSATSPTAAPPPTPLTAATSDPTDTTYPNNSPTSSATPSPSPIPSPTPPVAAPDGIPAPAAGPPNRKNRDSLHRLEAGGLLLVS